MTDGGKTEGLFAEFPFAAQGHVKHLNHRGDVIRFKEAGADRFGCGLHRGESGVDVQRQRIFKITGNGGAQGIMHAVTGIHHAHQFIEILQGGIAEFLGGGIQHLHRRAAGSDMHTPAANGDTAVALKAGQFNLFRGGRNHCIGHIAREGDPPVGTFLCPVFQGQFTNIRRRIGHADLFKDRKSGVDDMFKFVIAQRHKAPANGRRSCHAIGGRATSL